MYMLEISIFVYMCMEGRMEGRQEIILVDCLIQILLSLDMLETKITVHMWKEEGNYFKLSITDRDSSVYVRGTNFCVYLEGRRENPSGLSITDTDFCAHVLERWPPNSSFYCHFFLEPSDCA